jgi:hypothetical protein
MNSTLNTALFTGSIATVVAAIFFWAKVIRRTRKRRYDYPKRATSPGNKKSPALFSSARKQKHRRRSGIVANPTLAETRGLPPVREDHRAAAGHYQN